MERPWASPPLPEPQRLRFLLRRRGTPAPQVPNETTEGVWGRRKPTRCKRSVNQPLVQPPSGSSTSPRRSASPSPDPGQEGACLHRGHPPGTAEGPRSLGPALPPSPVPPSLSPQGRTCWGAKTRQLGPRC